MTSPETAPYERTPVPVAHRPGRPSRAWRTARITPLAEVLAPGRVAATLIRLCVQILLVVCLWRALYANTTSSAGLDREQAVTFAVLAVLTVPLRGLDRHNARDSVIIHLYLGTIVFWFLRPLPPARYYLYRALGDQLYGLAWALAGYGGCLAFGVLAPPVSAGAGAVCAVSLLLGQCVLYQLTLIVDLLCFWTMRDMGVLQILNFLRNLLSGAYAPLWYFPGWFQSLSVLLPFQSTLNTPLSLYIGRISLSAAPAQLAAQAFWVAGLALLSRWLWRKASQRVVSQGG
ncbi:ABC-2 family transporter protein [Streptomyces sp. NPDC006332]|uniref:ABC transporter permease n=1 Tax=Streptomyces sp. NPDC006332 TaxID=3155456 RepID=UPI0033B3CB60